MNTSFLFVCKIKLESRSKFSVVVQAGAQEYVVPAAHSGLMVSSLFFFLPRADKLIAAFPLSLPCFIVYCLHLPKCSSRCKAFSWHSKFSGNGDDVKPSFDVQIVLEMGKGLYGRRDL